MRLWSLVAQKVLAAATRGYTHHPQLERFRAHANASATPVITLAQPRAIRISPECGGHAAALIRAAMPREGAGGMAALMRISGGMAAALRL